MKLGKRPHIDFLHFVSPQVAHPRAIQLEVGASVLDYGAAIPRLVRVVVELVMPSMEDPSPKATPGIHLKWKRDWS